MSRFLFVTWDGAGNLVPTLGLARRLAARQHDVRVLGHRSIDARVGRAGWRFRELRWTADVDSARGRDGGDDMHAMARQVWFDGGICAEVRDELSRESADVLVGDCLLPAALCTAEAMELPAVALFHGALTPFLSGPFADLLARMLAPLNDIRTDLQLAPVDRVPDVYDRCALSVVASPREFEPPRPLPGNVAFAGPFLDAPPLLSPDADTIDGTTSAPILVSFSTSQQGHLPVLQRVVEALSAAGLRALVTTGPAIDPRDLRGGSSVEIVRFVAHDLILRHAALVITHAGMGTVMSALARGVPLLCLPVGRDQFFNAARVAALGAGRTLDAGAEPAAIAAAVDALLADSAAADAARHMARVIAGYDGGAAVVGAMERIAEAAITAAR
jgi:UDP:flavonoid glycosyltransferase YjiC (YdhE family)